MEQLAKNHTFKCILATLLAMGNFLNGSQVRNGVRGDTASPGCCEGNGTDHGTWGTREGPHEAWEGA